MMSRVVRKPRLPSMRDLEALEKLGRIRKRDKFFWFFLLSFGISIVSRFHRYGNNMASLTEVVGESSTTRLNPLSTCTSDPSQTELAVPKTMYSLRTNSGVDIPLSSIETIINMPDSNTPTGLASMGETCRQDSTTTKTERKSFLKLEKFYSLVKWLQKCIHDADAKADENMEFGYHKFQHRNYFKYPQGWPQLAAALDNPEQGLFRVFGTAHTRLLTELAAQISALEKKLFKEDCNDKDRDPESLRTLDGLEKESKEKKRLKKQLASLLRQYVSLALNLNQLRHLCPAPEWKIKNMWNYLHGKNGPLGDGEYDMYCEVDDLVCLNGEFRHTAQTSKIDEWLEQNLTTSPDLFWTRILKLPPLQGATDKASFFDRDKLKTLSKTFVVVIVVMILLIPNFLMWLQPMNAAGTTSVFTVAVVVFVMLMSALTHATVENIMIAACGYCAVLVTILVVTRGTR
ncbi:hypothetical protein F5884DRAFT_384382 [Xylogone sp. PMI_703]|nr:hypothetical protein F5884DRAFT_384382 [Xylogone sp. PMI_703]